jgi:hypothetical protein
MMTFSYQSPVDPSLWHLGAGQALSLPSQPGQRQLRVATGRVWVTFSAPAQAAARPPSTPHEAVDLPLADGDHWLCAGQTLTLPAHAAAVLEAWPQAAFSVREMPPQAQVLQRVRAICGRVGVPGRCETAALT